MNMQHKKSKKDKRKAIARKKDAVDVSDPGVIEEPHIPKNPQGPMELDEFVGNDITLL